MMKSDLEDRMKIRKKLSDCINPLTETGDEFSDGIVNIATGKVTASSQTNVHNLKQIGDLQLKVLRASLPCGFHQPISSGVTTAAKKVKKLKSADGNRETKDIGAIFNQWHTNRHEGGVEVWAHPDASVHVQDERQSADLQSKIWLHERAESNCSYQRKYSRHDHRWRMCCSLEDTVAISKWNCTGLCKRLPQIRIWYAKEERCHDHFRQILWLQYQVCHQIK